MRLLFLILALFPACYAQRFRFSQVDKSIVVRRTQRPPASQQERRLRLRELFTQAGCTGDALREEPLDKSQDANLICRLSGKTKDTIIVGANYNQMAPDNWTAAALLPSLFQSLVARQRHYTFVFVAFADGNSGLAGSHFFAIHLSPDELGRTEVMVNLDALGFSPTKVSPNSDKDLVKAFINVVYALKLMASQVDISKGVRLDAETFSSLNIPQITLHSLTQEAVADLHQAPAGAAPASDPSEFRPDLYYSSYRLISGFLAYLDETLKPRHKK